MKNTPQSVVAVSDDALRPKLLDALLDDDSDYEIVYVEAIESAYTRIRQRQPDLVLVFMEFNDDRAYQLLSMIKIDSDLSDIPVVTWTTELRGHDIDRVTADAIPELDDRIDARPTH